MHSPTRFHYFNHCNNIITFGCQLEIKKAYRVSINNQHLKRKIEFTIHMNSFYTSEST